MCVKDTQRGERRGQSIEMLCDYSEAVFHPVSHAIVCAAPRATDQMGPDVYIGRIPVLPLCCG